MWTVEKLKRFAKNFESPEYQVQVEELGEGRLLVSQEPNDWLSKRLRPGGTLAGGSSMQIADVSTYWLAIVETGAPYTDVFTIANRHEFKRKLRLDGKVWCEVQYSHRLLDGAVVLDFALWHGPRERPDMPCVTGESVYAVAKARPAPVMGTEAA